MSPRWSRFCVVGLGKHARTRIIPAIAANGQELAGVVSRKPDAPAFGAPAFATLEEALATLPGDTAFIIASPPTAHFAQATAVLSAGRDLIVEKPPFVTRSEAEVALRAASEAGVILVEGFMNRHTLTHGHFVAACRKQMPTGINFAFTIPEAPVGTFRTDREIGSSNLYDIGSYVLAALLDVALPLDALSLCSVDNAGFADRERVHLVGHLQDARTEALIGVDREYANRLELSWDDGRSISYEPFFFGRQAERTLVYTDGSGTRSETIRDVDAFAAMFAIPPAIWAADAEERGERTLLLATHLERLGRDLAAARGS